MTGVSLSHQNADLGDGSNNHYLSYLSIYLSILSISIYIYMYICIHIIYMYIYL